MKLRQALSSQFNNYEKISRVLPQAWHEFRTKVAGVAVMTNRCALWARHYVKSFKFNLQSNLGEGTDNVKFKEED